MKECKFCGGTPKLDILTVICQKCGARTENFTGKGGRCQVEEMMAEEAWDRGEYEGPRGVLLHELKVLRGALRCIELNELTIEQAREMATQARERTTSYTVVVTP